MNINLNLAVKFFLWAHIPISHRKNQEHWGEKSRRFQQRQGGFHYVVSNAEITTLYQSLTKNHSYRILFLAASILINILKDSNLKLIAQMKHSTWKNIWNNIINLHFFSFHTGPVLSFYKRQNDLCLWHPYLLCSDYGKMSLVFCDKSHYIHLSKRWKIMQILRFFYEIKNYIYMHIFAIFLIFQKTQHVLFKIKACGVLFYCRISYFCRYNS